ncbi:MAG: response regulator transcription factor [Lachnospiraceae bacterium]|nr:response regulator transcription factor [Lachnospiraceae bacterium]
MRNECDTILIVEDDENAAKYIQTCLLMGQYKSVVCDNGCDAMKLLEEQSFDLILLDIMLPGMDGFEVQEHIKSKNIPIIFLTAMQDVMDKVRGLKAGAEDYIVKPFEVMELLARVEVVLRRCRKDNIRYVYGDIEVDAERHIVLKKGEPVAVSPKEFEVLCYFIKYQDIVISRERLLADLWDIHYQGETRTVDTHVQQLRRKLDLRDKMLSIPKYGYKLVRG